MMKDVKDIFELKLPKIKETLGKLVSIEEDYT